MTHSEIVSFLWGVADLIRDSLKRGKYQDVILPFTMLRRLDCVLAPTKKKVLEANARFKGKLDNPDNQLRRASGFAFYNTSKYDFDALLDDHAHLKQEQLYAALDPLVDRYEQLLAEDKATFRSRLGDYVRLYAFLSQVLTFTDSDLEKLYALARLLRRRLPVEGEPLPVEVQEAIDMSSYRVESKFSGSIALERGGPPLDPLTGGAVFGGRPEQVEPLSRIIQELNERFGTEFKDEDRLVIRQLEERLARHESLADSLRVNTPENARLTFDQVVSDQLQDLADTNFKFYKRVTDDEAFSKHFLNWLFERLRSSSKGQLDDRRAN